MRAYFFGNMYISPIQHGIQAAHVITEMHVKYQPHQEEYQEAKDMFNDWAENHKTMILLNGGYGETLHELYEFFEQKDHPYAFAKFHESEAALDNALTSVGIVLPEKIYNGAAKLRRRLPDDEYYMWQNHRMLMFAGEDNVMYEEEYTKFDDELMTRLNTFRLV